MGMDPAKVHLYALSLSVQGIQLVNIPLSLKLVFSHYQFEIRLSLPLSLAPTMLVLFHYG